MAKSSFNTKDIQIIGWPNDDEINKIQSITLILINYCI